MPQGAAEAWPFGVWAKSVPPSLQRELLTLRGNAQPSVAMLGSCCAHSGEGDARRMTPPRSVRSAPASLRFVLAVTLGCFAVALVLYYPGSLSYDPTVQWYEARFARVTSQHPPFMSFVWHWLDLLIAGPGLFLAFELAIFWSAVGCLLVALRAGRVAALLGALALLANPFLIVHSALVVKDVAGGNLALAGFALLWRLSRSPRSYGITIFAFVLIALAGLMRYQLWLLAAPAAVAVWLLAAREPGVPSRAALGRLAAAFAAAAATILLAQIAMRATLDLRPDFADYVARKVLVFDIAGIVVRAPDAGLAGFAAEGIDVEALRRRARADYTPYNSDVASGAVDAMVATLDTATIAAQWWALIRQAPLAFAAERLETFGLFLGFGRVYECWPRSTVGFLGQPVDKWRALGGAALKESYATTLLRAPLFPAGTLLFRPVTYLLLSIVLFVAWYRAGGRDHRVIGMAMLVGAWLYWLSFAVAPLTCEVRYSYFPCAAVLIASLCWIIDKAMRWTSPAALPAESS
jgi:hypothetical protein